MARLAAYPLTESLFAVFAGVLCSMEDIDEIADEALAKTCTTHTTTDSGHGRIGERCIRVTGGAGWLRELHPNWAGPRCIVAVTSVRTHKTSGATSKETRFYITSLPPDPEPILAAIRAHWGIENTLHWPLDVTFREDSSRLRKDNAAAKQPPIWRSSAKLPSTPSNACLPSCLSNSGAFRPP